VSRATVLAAVVATATAAAAAALALPQPALAHATLKQTTPTFGQRLSSGPPRVILQFDQQVMALPSSIRVVTGSGRLVSGTARNGSDPRTLEAPLRARLQRAGYTVRWHALSADGHVVSGVYTFGVGVAAPPPSEAYGAGGPTWSDHLVRWLYFVSLALLLGGLAFRLVVVPGSMPRAYERRFFAVTGIGVAATLETGIVAFVLRADDALQLPFGRLLYGDLSPLASGTRFGIAFIAMTLGFATVAALLFLGWLTDRRAFLVAALLVGLGFASGLSLSGHSAVDAGSSWISILADWLHLVAATLWVGGLVQLAVCVWPSVPDPRRAAFLAFARLAPALIAVLVACGVYLSVVRLPAVSDLWEEGYGRVLLIKLALVTLALAWGGTHHFFVRPLLERGRTPRLLVRSLAGEGAVGMAILLAAAVLVDSKPPVPVPQPAQASVPARR
jgi:copper transport protein